MPAHNADIAAIFVEIADLLEIRGNNPFRIRAYCNAAHSVGEFGREFNTLIESGSELPKLPGIGADLTAKIHEIVTTGHCATLDKLRKEMPQRKIAESKVLSASGAARGSSRDSNFLYFADRRLCIQNKETGQPWLP